MLGRKGSAYGLVLQEGDGRCSCEVIVLRRIGHDAEGWRKLSATEALTNRVHGVINVAHHQHHFSCDIVTFATSYLSR